MKCQILLCVCLLIVLDAVVSAESKRAVELGTGKFHKERQLLKKGSLSKPKLHYTTTAAHVETKYGVDLPSFAFDYSEYFSGAVIERSHDNDLYLSVFMVGHKSISTDFPFHAISTDEEVLHSWSKAVNLWDKNSHKRVPAPNSRRLSAVTTEVSPRSPHPSHTAHSTSHHSSGLVCVLQNNDITPSQVYQASAYWVQAEHDADSTSTKNIFAVLRCKLKNTAVIYETISNHTTTALFVDIMRMNTNNRKTNTRANSRNSTSTNTSTSASDSSVASDSRGSVLSSFSVPWSTRVVGYPLQHHSNASTLNPWVRKTDTVTVTPTTTSAAPITPITSTPTTTTHIAHATTTTTTSTLLCVPNVRPLHPRRPTALPQLIEYIEHYIQLGYEHIMLGVALDWKSKHMHKYLHVLSPYIRSGQISIYSTTLPGFDDVAGFGGIQLHDTYAEQYFVNMCLYYAKGMYSYVSVGRVEEVIVSGVVYSGSADASSGTFVQNVLSKLVRGGGGTSNKVPTTTRGTSRVHTNSMIQHAPCVYALTTTSPTTAHTTSSTTTTSTTNTTPKTNLRGARPATTTRTTNSTTSTSSSIHRNMLGKVTGRLDVYTVQDMSGAGPGEDVWSRDYYASTVPQPLPTTAATNMYSVLFLPADRVVRVEMAPSGVVTGHCKSVQSQYRRRSSSNSGSGSNSTSVRATLYTTTATVNTPDVALFVYRNTHSSTTLNTTNTATTTTSATDSASTILRKYTHARAVMHNTTTTVLSQRFISLASIKTLSQEALIVFSDAHKSAQSAQPFNPFSDAPIPNKDQLSGDLPTRAAVKAPFWQLCNTDYLKDVIRKVFHV